MAGWCMMDKLQNSYRSGEILVESSILWIFTSGLGAWLTGELQNSHLKNRTADKPRPFLCHTHRILLISDRLNLSTSCFSSCSGFSMLVTTRLASMAVNGDGFCWNESTR